MTHNAVFHYLQRSRELGLRGTVERAWARTTDAVVLWSQSCWWGWRARRRMSDTALLARTIGDWQSMPAFIEHLAGRSGSSFILPHASPDETAAILSRYCPEYVSALFAAADAACRNELSLLDRPFAFAQGIDWHRDPITQWRWPLAHRSRLDRYFGSPCPPDPIVVWELNRHQHFITLGIAFWLTNDKRYVDAFNSQVQSWIKTNPLQHGINWVSALEVAIRLVAWTVAFQFFRGSPAFRETTAADFLKSLWQQTEFLHTHLQATSSPSTTPNNHMIAELTGLALVGAAFPEFRKSTAWRATGLSLLEQQAPAQTHSDGVNKEHATGYHRFVAELLILIVARSRQGALPPVPSLERTLEGMLEYVFATSMPDGTAPMWGDSASGRAVGFDYRKDFWDFRPLLSAGAVLFGRADWKFVAGGYDETAWWLLGADGLELWERLKGHRPTQTSWDFPDAGLYGIRDSWDPNTDVAVFRCGPFGLGVKASVPTPTAISSASFCGSMGSRYS